MQCDRHWIVGINVFPHQHAEHQRCAGRADEVIGKIWSKGPAGASVKQPSSILPGISADGILSAGRDSGIVERDGGGDVIAGYIHAPVLHLPRRCPSGSSIRIVERTRRRTERFGCEEAITKRPLWQ